MSGGLSPGNVGRTLVKGAASTGRLATSFGARCEGRLPRSVRRRGYLRPGDPAPPPGADLLDYRGVATRSEVAGLEGGELPMGRLLGLGSEPGPELGLPANLLLRHVAVLGPSGSGKTTSIIVPWIVQLLRLGASVVTVDVKGDLLAQIQGHAAATGGPTGSRLWYWDAAASRSHRWNWLAEAADAQRIEAAVTSVIGRLRDTDPQPHFHHRDHRWLRALVMLVRAVHGPDAQPSHLLATLNDRRELAAAVNRAAPGDAGVVDLTDLLALGSDEYSRAVAGLTNALAVFGLTSVRRVTAESDFQVADVCDRPTLLVAGAPLAHGRVSEVLSGMMTAQALLGVLDRFNNLATCRPLFFVLDEAPRLTDRVDFEQLLAVARGAHVGVCLAAQDVTQFGDERERTAVLANCHSMVLMPGSSQPTADVFAHRLGERWAEVRSTSRSPGRAQTAPVTYNRQATAMPVLGRRELMHPPFGSCVAAAHVPSVSRAPFLVDLER